MPHLLVILAASVSVHFLWLMIVALPLALDRGLRPDPDAPQPDAQLSGDGASALALRRLSSGDPPVLHRERRGRHALQPGSPQPGLRARQERACRRALRHRTGCLRAGLRVVRPFPGTEAPGGDALPGRGRRPGLQAALFHGPAQCLGHELRGAQRQCHPRPQQGRQAGRLRPRHRRGRAHQVPPGARRRSRLGNRQRLLRLPHAGGCLRPGDVQGQGEPGRRQVHQHQAFPRAPSRAWAGSCRRPR